MSVQEVGLENLPNCYISNIEIYNGSRVNNKYSITVSIKDIKQYGSWTWYDEKQLYDNMQLIVVLSENESFNSDVESGSVVLTRKTMNRYRGGLTYNIVNVKKKWDLKKIIKKETESGVVHTFSFDFNMLAKKNAQNLKVYAALFINTSEFSANNAVDLHSRSIVYGGPVASETIKTNGKLNTSTMLLTKPDGSVHIGPYHIHRNRFMEGSFHTTNPHDVLSRTMVKNPKIKDYTDEAFTRPVLDRVDKGQMFFNNYSSKGKDSFSMFFGFDTRGILLNKSKMAQKIANLDPSFVNDLLSKIKIEKMRVVKTKVTKVRGFSRLGVPKFNKSRDLERMLLSESKDSAPLRFQPDNNIEELILSQNPAHRQFKITEKFEKNLPAPKGDYTYSLVLSFNDPSYEFVNEIVEEIKEANRKFKTFLARLDRTSSTLEDDLTLSDIFKSREMSLRPRVEDLDWFVALRVYVKYYSIISNLTEDQESEFLSKISFMVHPLFATKRSILFFDRKFRKMYSYIRKFLGFSKRTNSDQSTRGMGSASSEKNKIKVTTMLEENINFDTEVAFVNYVKTKNNALTRRELQRIAQRNRSKFFRKKPNFTDTQISRISEKVENNLLSSFNDISNSKVSFLSVVSIAEKDRNDEIKLDSVNSAFTRRKEISKTMERIRNKEVRKDTPTRPEIKKRKNKLSIKPAREQQFYTDGEKQQFKESRDNLGKSNQFQNSDEDFQESLGRRASDSINSSKITSKKRKTNKYLASSNPDTATLLTKAKSEKSKAHNLPLSMRALFGSESNSVVSTVKALGSNPDVSSDHETSDVIDLLFGTPARVEYLSGYERNSKGVLNVKAPIFELLTDSVLSSLQTPFMCRMSFYELEGITEQKEGLEIAGKYFIVNDRTDVNTKSEIQVTTEFITDDQVLRVFQSLDSASLEYLISNPIRQSRNRLGPIDAADVPVQKKNTIAAPRPRRQKLPENERPLRNVRPQPSRPSRARRPQAGSTSRPSQPQRESQRSTSRPSRTPRRRTGGGGY
jgi:hypothetical protein